MNEEIAWERRDLDQGGVHRQAEVSIECISGRRMAEGEVGRCRHAGWVSNRLAYLGLRELI